MTRGMRSFWRWSTASLTAGTSTRASAACRPAGGKSVAFLSMHFYLDGQETLQVELCSEPGSVIRINYQNAGPWPGGKSGAELFSEAMEILGK